MRLRPLQFTPLFGIPVKISYSWFPVVGLHIYAVSALYLPRHLHRASPGELWTLGVLVTILLFLSVLGHELGHCLFARAEGIKILDITLHLFGGLARFDREAPSPLAEFKIAVAGPAFSFLYSVVFFGLNQASIYIFNSLPAAIITNYLGLSNLILAVFNLLPGFPLDGGRVLRAALWHWRGDIRSATQSSVRSGQAIAYLLIACGAFWLLTSKTSADIFAAVWSIFIGIFIKDAADGSFGYFRQLYALEDLHVRDAMTVETVAIKPDTTLHELINDILPHHRLINFPVSEGGRLRGILSLKAVRSIPPARWADITAREVMRPMSHNLLVHPQTSLVEAHHLLSENQIGYAAVIEQDGRLVGGIGLDEIRKKISV